MDDNNTAAIADLNIPIAAYNGLIKDLLNIHVPSNITGTHIDAINELSKIASDIKAFKTAISDPLVATVAIKDYFVNIQSFGETYQTLKTYISENSQ